MKRKRHRNVSTSNMLLRLVLTLSFSVLAAGELRRTIRLKEGKTCVAGNVHDVFIKLGKLNQRPGPCKEKCVLDEKCEAVQYIAPRSCMLWYNPIDKMGPAEPGTYCGRARTKDSEGITYSNPPNGGPTYIKSFVIRPDTKCANINFNRAELFKQYTSRQECQQNCYKMTKCKSFQWNGKRNTCVLIKYKATSEPVRRSSEERVCGYLPKSTDYTSRPPVVPVDGTKIPTMSPIGRPKFPTKQPIKSPVVYMTEPPTKKPTNASFEVPTNYLTEAPPNSPTKAPTKAPTMSPTMTPTMTPTKTPIMCTLQAKLAFPFGDDPKNAYYYGYHSDFIEVTKVGAASDDICSYWYSDYLPEWCTYQNSDPNGDSAYVANLDDAYYDDIMLSTETIEIFNAAGSSFNFAVSHFFFDEDYYSDVPGWEDHLMAAVLKINNLSHGSQTALNADGWSHPTDFNTPTHVQGQENPDYQGDFTVTVTCDDNCLCDASSDLAIEKECTLRAKLAFPFGDDPNGADYYGYHSDYMEVTKVGAAADDICSFRYSDDLPAWCTYQNSDPNGDSAYVASLDDAYYAEEIVTSETVEIFNAAGSSFNFAVSHFFFGNDYYSDVPGWEDHLLAAVLKINNLSHGSQTALKADGWSHPVDINTPTHIQKQNGSWKVNPGYKGDFTVTVTCDDNCLCGASYALA